VEHPSGRLLPEGRFMESNPAQSQKGLMCHIISSDPGRRFRTDVAFTKVGRSTNRQRGRLRSPSGSLMFLGHVPDEVQLN
jgi:hypothetical protein